MRAEEESGSSFQLPGVVRSLIPREVLEKGAGVASPSVRPHPPPPFFFFRGPTIHVRFVRTWPLDEERG